MWSEGIGGWYYDRNAFDIHTFYTWKGKTAAEIGAA